MKAMCLDTSSSSFTKQCISPLSVLVISEIVALAAFE